jgi:hypothetical protein
MELVKELELDEFNWKLRCYLEKEFGLRVFWIDVPGPTVSGYFVIPTEAHVNEVVEYNPGSRWMPSYFGAFDFSWE